MPRPHRNIETAAVPPAPTALEYHPGVPAPKDPAVVFSLILGWAWMMVTLGGAVALLGGGVLPGGTFLSVPRSVFQAVSAATLTGFPAATGVDTFLPYGRGVVFFLIAVGTLFSLVLGGLACKRISGVRVSDGTVVLTAGAMLGVAALVGASDPFSTGSVFSGVFSAVAALGNSAAFVHLPTITDFSLIQLLVPLSWVGGLGVVVVLDVGQRLLRRTNRLTDFSRAALVLTAGVFIVLAAIFYLIRPATGGVSPVLSAIVLSAVTSTTGTPVEYATQWSRPLQVVATLFSATGFALGGTSAGVGLTTLAIIANSLWSGLRNGTPPTRAFYLSVRYVLLFLGLTLATWLLLLSSEPQIQADRLLTISSSAAANSGMTHDPVSIVGRGLFILAAAMFAGRALSLLYLWQLATTPRQRD